MSLGALPRASMLCMRWGAQPQRTATARRLGVRFVGLLPRRTRSARSPNRARPLAPNRWPHNPRLPTDLHFATHTHAGLQVAGAWLPRESDDDRLLDTIMLRLRLADGLDLCQLARQHPQGGEAADLLRAALAPHAARGWVLTHGGGGGSKGSAGSSSSNDGSSGRSSGGGGGLADMDWVRLADPDGFIVSNDIISDCFAALDVTEA